MAQGRVTDDTQLLQMVTWLDEQRKLDKDQLQSLQQDIERLNVSVRELTAQVSKLGDELTQSQSRLATLPLVDESLRQTREHLLNLQQRLDESQEAQGKEVLLRQAEAERDHRALVDVGHQVLEIRKIVESEDSRVRSVVDEMKRTRTSLDMLPDQMESVDKAISGVGSRVQVLEELVRRHDSRITWLEKAAETIQSDHSRMLQWQQAAELRWNRQLSTWQKQMEDWQREAEDRVKLVQQFIKQMNSAREETQELRLGIADLHQRSEDQAAELMRLEGLRTRDREDARRTEQVVEAQRRRADEQAGAIKQLQEQFLQGVQETASLVLRIDAEQRRMEEVGAQVSYLDQRYKQSTESLDQLRRDMRDLSQKIEQHVQRWLLQVEEDRHRLEEHMEEAQRLEEQQKMREIAELERQIVEMRERFSKMRTS